MTSVVASAGLPRNPVSEAVVADMLGRPMPDLRVSVMPKEVFGRDYAFLPRNQLLTFEEITRVVGSSARLGVEKG